MKKVKSLYDTSAKHFLAAIIGFVLTYAAASWGIDSGNLLVYLLTIVLLVVSVKHVISGIKMIHG